MSVWVRSARWLLAIFLAALGFGLGAIALASLFRAFGRHAGQNYMWIVYAATVSAALMGALVASSDQRGSVTKAIVAFVSAVALAGLGADLLGNTFQPADAYEVLGSAMGGLSAIRCIRNAPAGPAVA